MGRFDDVMKAQRGVQTISYRRKNVNLIDDDELFFSIVSKDQLLVTIDLRSYRDGDAESGLCGNPSLISEMLPYIRDGIVVKRRSKKAIGLWLMKSVKTFFSFLSKIEIETGKKIESFSDFCEYDGLLLKNFLLNMGGDQKSRRKTYTKIYTMIREIRPKSAGHLVWPTYHIAPKSEVHADVDPRAVREIYHTCKRIIEEHDVNAGRVQQWLIAGDIAKSDPRFQISLAQRDHIKAHICSPEPLNRQSRKEETLKFWREKGALGFEGMYELFSAFAPSAIEITATILIVSMETGWIDTVHGIDLSKDWFSNRSRDLTSEVQGTDTVVVYSKRPKTGKSVVAIGMAGSRYRSFRLIKRLQERSEYIRQCLQVRLNLIHGEKRSGDIQKEIFEIQQKLKSPWIYYAAQAGSGSRCVGLSNAPKLAQVLTKIKDKTIDGLAPKKRNDVQLISAIKSIIWSDMRDAFAEHIYESSGGNIYVLRRGLDHNDIDISRRYINQRRQIRARFDAFRSVIESALGELGKDRPLDPTIVYLVANFGGVSQDDRKRLERFRTRMGMGCSDPTRPDSHIAQGHKKGAVCSVQRCILCSKGVIFSDAFEGIADRYGDLLWLRNNISPQRWLTSSLWWELNATELVRDKIFALRRAEFDRRSTSRLSLIESGDAFVFDDPGCGGVFHWETP